MKLNKSTNDAIRILVDCARAEGALVKVAELSSALDITMQNVFKIVHILSRAGLVAAVRGRHGGVRLSRPPAEIRVGDVVRAMESTDFASVGGRGAKRTGTVSDVLDSALEAFLAVLDEHSLADMMKSHGRAKPAGIDRVRASKAKSRTVRVPAVPSLQPRAKS